ncbi:MAG: fimbrillin family protein [Bacteroidales bacterium]|nr:fimbrillin family protein [Bacteroidales bacterium]
MKKVLFIITVAALALVSCQRSEPVQNGAARGEVRFTTNIQTYNVKATDTAFEDNDVVGIFAGSPIVKNNVRATVTGTELALDEKIYWPDGVNAAIEFVAYYPYATDATQTYAFAVQADQSAEANYKKSDLLIAKTIAPPSDNAVALAFKHALSKVELTIDNQVAGVTVNGVNFEGVALNGTVALASGEISALGDKANVKAFKKADKVYQLLIMPQTAQPKVRVSLSNGNSVVYELASAFTFNPGKKASASLVVKEAAQQDAVVFSFSVEDWGQEQTNLGFGEGSMISGEVWSVIGSMNGDNWQTPIPMTQNVYGDWEADIVYAEGDEFKLRKGAEEPYTWVGMQPSWNYYGLGDFGNDTNYLQAGDEAINIKLEAAGEYHLYFTASNNWFVVTKTSEDPEPETVKLTLNVYNGAGWDALKLYVWNGATQIAGEWPGMDPAEADVTVNNVVYKSFVIAEYPKGVACGYILNNVTGGAQTADLEAGILNADATIYLWLKADLSVAEIENPATFDPNAQ